MRQPDERVKKASEHAINTSSALLARRPIFAPVERVRRRAQRGGAAWHVAGDGYKITVIDDVLTESDCDLIEWLIAHGKPGRVQGGRVAFTFSLYEAARALGQGRARIKQRIRRMQKTVVSVRDGDWVLEAQIFGPTLRNVKSGVFLATMTPEFVQFLGRGARIYYHDFVDDIIAISSPVVRRLVRRTLSHERRDKGERLARILDDIQVGFAAQSPDDIRKVCERAVQDVLDAADYLEAVFGIKVRNEDQPRVYYVQDRRERRIFVDTGDHAARSARIPTVKKGESGLSGPVKLKRSDSADL